ncbi:MAG: type II toxin-antitoxin system RelB/DinJ family antitoxin [Patescibacteria group bacterium]
MARIEIRIRYETKDRAQEVLKKIGFTMTGAIKMYLKYVVEKGKLPFRLPKVKVLLSREEEFKLTPEEFGKYLKSLGKTNW